MGIVNAQLEMASDNAITGQRPEGSAAFRFRNDLKGLSVNSGVGGNGFDGLDVDPSAGSLRPKSRILLS